MSSNSLTLEAWVGVFCHAPGSAWHIYSIPWEHNAVLSLHLCAVGDENADQPICFGAGENPALVTLEEFSISSWDKSVCQEVMRGRNDHQKKLGRK